MMLEFGVPASEENLLLRLAVEHFLFEEAAHLDSWRLDEWLTLFTEDAHYLVPTTDHPDGDPSQDMMFIDEVIGAGEIAISDERATEPSIRELAKLIADTRMGGMLSKKAGLTHVMLDVRRDSLTEMIENLDIVAKEIRPAVNAA